MDKFIFWVSVLWSCAVAAMVANPSGWVQLLLLPLTALFLAASVPRCKAELVPDFRLISASRPWRDGKCAGRRSRAGDRQDVPCRCERTAGGARRAPTGGAAQRTSHHATDRSHEPLPRTALTNRFHGPLSRTASTDRSHGAGNYSGEPFSSRAAIRWRTASWRRPRDS